MCSLDQRSLRVSLDKCLDDLAWTKGPDESIQVKGQDELTQIVDRDN